MGNATTETTPSSPCTGVCRVENGNCVGCGRTLDHIAQWGGMSEKQRLAVMAQLGNHCPGCGRALPPLDARAPCLCPGCGVHCCEGSV